MMKPLLFRFLALALFTWAAPLAWGQAQTCTSTPPAGKYCTLDYWIVPSGRNVNLQTFYNNPCPDGTTKTNGIGQHAFWSGSMLGKTVALQGHTGFADPDKASYDVYEITAGTNRKIQYWGTFRGNGLNQGPLSNAFATSTTWMNQHMGIGDSVTTTITDNEMHNQLRKNTQSAPQTITVTVQDHLASFFDAQSGRTWNDVLYVEYLIGTRLEKYWLARGFGTVRFESTDNLEPSCINHQYATTYNSYVPPAAPTTPWYDPFKFTTYVPNGFFQDLLIPPLNGGQPLKTYERSWTSASNGTVDSFDVAISNDLPNAPASEWKVILRAAPTAGWDYAVSSPIPVTAGKTYRLSGWLYRTNSSDDVYIDFNDLVAGDNIYTTVTNAWQFVQGQVNVGTATSLRIRCVRDKGNAGNAYCDGITLQRVN